MRSTRVVVCGGATVFSVALAAAGCSGTKDSAAPVSAADLQQGIAERMGQAGTPAKSVSCRKDLAGTVGSTARCEVVYPDTNSVYAVVTTSRVQGGITEWEITLPSMTKDQLIKRVAAGDPAKSVTCDTGLEGVVGNWTQCQITANGFTMNRGIEVKDVRGLTMDLSIRNSLPQLEAENLLLAKIASAAGVRPDQAHCIGDLAATVGSTLECTVVTGGTKGAYVLTVTGVSPAGVDFSYAKVNAG